jgi:hypothetical protein
MFGQGDVFEAEPFADPAFRNFYERYRSGEKIKASWANIADFEKEPLK